MSPQNSKPKRITLADVAAVAGVSVKTVSHVLSGNPTVRLPESTREKVRLAADKVGYRANRFAQSIQSGRTDLISVWLPLERLNPNFFAFLNEISQRAQASDHGILVSGIDAEFAYTGSGPSPKAWPVDGVIAVDSGKSIVSFRQDPRNDSIPVSVLGFEQFKNADSVGWEVAVASRQVTESLIQKGCTNIVHLTLDWVVRDFPREQRRRGYTEAMTEAGLQPHTITVGKDTGHEAWLAVQDYLAHHPMPQAITCFSDRLATGAIQAVQHAGATVPGDCRVWGFGDMPEGQDWSLPISTIRIPISQIVDQSWTWLLERIEDPTIETRLVRLPMEIIERDSG